MKLFVAAIIKNEMDALLEWIAYHRVVGVSGFIIADNGSNDGSRAFLDGLEKLGIVTVLDFPDVVGQKPQLPAYERILRTCSTDIDLLAFIDADEFWYHSILNKALPPVWTNGLAIPLSLLSL